MREPWCAICGSETDLTADHVTPVAAGGAIDGPLRTLCRPCNSSLGATVRRGQGGVDDQARAQSPVVTLFAMRTGWQDEA